MPDRAYFGQKDLQQFAVIRQLAKTLDIGVELVRCPIIREPSGLAMSSRNDRLSPDGKETASIIYETIKETKNLLKENSVSTTTAILTEKLISAKSLELEYLEIVDAETLKRTETDTHPIAVCVAAYVEGVRLIDNMIIN